MQVSALAGLIERREKGQGREGREKRFAGQQNLEYASKEFFDFKRQKPTRLSSERESRDVFHRQR